MKLLAVIIFFLANTCAAQCPAGKSFVQKGTEPSTITKDDSVAIVDGDTANLLKAGSGTTIVLLKESAKTDYFNYILPIFTLLLGIAIDRLWDWCNDRKRVIKAGKRWVAELRNLNEPIKKQIEFIGSFLDTHNQDKFGPPHFTMLDVLRCEIFKTLDKSELLKYIELRRKLHFDETVAISSRTGAFISVLAYQFQNLQERFNEYRNNASKYVFSFNSNLQALMGSILDYQLALEKELGDAKKSKEFVRITALSDKEIRPHLNDGKYEMFALEKNFFEPLSEILYDLRGDERTKQIRVIVVECRRNIKAIKMEKVYLAEVFLKVKERYELSSGQLTKLIDEIDGKL